MHKKKYTSLKTSTAGAHDAVSTQQCVILRYCRVAQLCHDPLQLAVEPYRFEDHMQYLTETCNVISLTELTRHVKEKRPFPHRTVALTFDYGYRDVRDVVMPVLDSFALPATVFVPTANMVEHRCFWWDELEDLVIVEHERNEIELDIDGRFHHWSLANPSERFGAFESLMAIFNCKPPWQQRELLDVLHEVVDTTTGDRDNHRTLTAQDLMDLERTSLMSVGGYTHHAAALDSLSACQQVCEIGKNKRALEEVLEHEVIWFSHPWNNGGSGPDVAGMLQMLGYKFGLGSNYGTVDAERPIDRYDLPRVKAPNCNAFGFHQFLSRFFA